MREYLAAQLREAIANGHWNRCMELSKQLEPYWRGEKTDAHA